MSGPEGKVMYSVPEFCAAHHISRSYFYELMKEGKGPRITKIGRRTLVTIESAKKWVEGFYSDGGIV